ncbi:hypothetical protein [Legionella israelensis]|uniref:hypothetical protein n=1 Tax=Legionella israelensis TaxID=454 RepID=UPI00142F7A08|nr:hypothetical protein [Legionella israelensis]
MSWCVPAKRFKTSHAKPLHSLNPVAERSVGKSPTKGTLPIGRATLSRVRVNTHHFDYGLGNKACVLSFINQKPRRK